MAGETIPLELIKPALQQLTDLMTISATLVDSYYDLFLNPEPIANVHIKAYGSDGTIMELAIPNLAYLRQNCIVSSGSPEGVISASLGTFYLDRQDNKNGFYIKTGDISSDSATGWIQLSTKADIDQAIVYFNTLVSEMSHAIDAHDKNEEAHPFILRRLDDMYDWVCDLRDENYQEHTRIEHKLDTLLPTQSGNSYCYLMTNGSSLSWQPLETEIITISNSESSKTLTWGKAYKLRSDRSSGFNISGFTLPFNRHGSMSGLYENTILEFVKSSNVSISLSNFSYKYNYNMTPTWVNGATYRLTFDTLGDNNKINVYIAQRNW